MRDVFNAGPNETLLGEIVTSILNWTEGKTLGEAGHQRDGGGGLMTLDAQMSEKKCERIFPQHLPPL